MLQTRRDCGPKASRHRLYHPWMTAIPSMGRRASTPTAPVSPASPARGMQLLVWNGYKNAGRTCGLTLIP
jgi:hypothetical protein